MKFGLEKYEKLFNAPDGTVALKIILDSDEHVLNDEMLSLVSEYDNVKHLAIHKYRCKPSDLNVDIQVSPENLGRLNLEGLYLYMEHSGLTDNHFSKCSNLQYVYLGTTREPLMVDYPVHFARQPLKTLSVNYSGVLNAGAGLTKFIDTFKANGGNFVYYI
jgi:hypothetical protein